MKFKDLLIGERITIKIMLSDGTYSSSTYTSRIEDLQEPNQICFVSPTASDMKRWIGKKMQVIIAKDNAAYTCDVNVFEQKKENQIYLMWANILTDFSKVQRRKYYRQKIELNVKINEDMVKTIDISGNGLSLRMKEPMHINSEMEGILHLESVKIKYKASVIASELVKHPDEKDYYHVRVTYTDIDPRDQERIIKFINYQQTLSRRKNLLLKGE